MSDFNREPTPFYSHLLRGWGGFVTVMERMVQERWPMHQPHLDELKGYVARLQEVVKAQEELPR